MPPVPSWLCALVRPLVLLSLTGTVVYLALGGSPRAVEALIAQFVAITSYYMGERAGAALPQQLPPEK